MSPISEEDFEKAEFFEKGKTTQGVKVNGDEWIILTERREGVFEIVKIQLVDTLGVPGEGEKLLMRFDKDKKQLVIKKAKINYEIKVGFDK